MSTKFEMVETKPVKDFNISRAGTGRAFICLTYDPHRLGSMLPSGPLSPPGVIPECEAKSSVHNGVWLKNQIKQTNKKKDFNITNYFHIKFPYQTFSCNENVEFKIHIWNQSNRTGGKAFALHEVNLNFTSSIPYSSLSIAKSNS